MPGYGEAHASLHHCWCWGGGRSASGGRLGLVGHDVVLVARGDNLAALRDRGLRLRTPDEDVTCHSKPLGGLRRSLDIDDVLILATKTTKPTRLVIWTDVPVHRNGQPVDTAGRPADLHCAQWGRRRGNRATVLSAGLWGVRLDASSASGAKEVIIRSTPQSGMLHMGRCPRARRS